MEELFSFFYHPLFRPEARVETRARAGQRGAGGATLLVLRISTRQASMQCRIACCTCGVDDFQLTKRIWRRPQIS